MSAHRSVWRKEAVAGGLLVFAAILLLSVGGMLPLWTLQTASLCASCVAWCWLMLRIWDRIPFRKRSWFVFWSNSAVWLFAIPLYIILFEPEELPFIERLFGRLFIAVIAGICTTLIYYSIYKNKAIMRKKIVAGNWKMNTLPAEGVELSKNVAAGKGSVCECVNFIVCPPFTHISEVTKVLKGTGIAVGAQDCATEAKGAYTGEVSAAMIAALGCEYVILGHSERRQYYGETSATLNKKMEQAYANNLTPIYCVGENLDEREADKHFDVVKAQIEEVVYNLSGEQFAKLVIAYEPVWAIGTGKTATAEQAQEIHAYIRKVLATKFGAAAQQTAILYGGSCKPSNAAEIFSKEDVDGGLIGGAALVADDFLGIGKGFKK